MECPDRIDSMLLHRTPRLLASWIAVLTVLMAALAPSMSTTLGANSGSTLVEVCTSLGAKWLVRDGSAAEQPESPGDTQTSNHCPYCPLHASEIAVPASPLILVFGPARSEFSPAFFLTAPRTLYAWLSAQSRAPPSAS